MEKMPVLFRVGKDDEVTAFFPTHEANPGCIVCYAHVGQHSEASFRYYHEARLAKPEEYADLLAELRQIYDDCDLVVRRRLNALA
jgi:hypothetical protein